MSSRHRQALNIQASDSLSMKEDPAMRVTLGLLLIFLTICGGSSYAQSVGACVQGTLTDSNHAVIAWAKVTVRNAATGASREIEADDESRYHILLLSPGDYELQVSAS